MDVVMWIVVAVIVIGVVWWLVSRNNRNKDAGAAGPAGNTRPAATRPPGSPADRRADGALSGGSAAASAEAAGTAGLASAAGFGRPAEPAAPSAADEPADSAVASAGATTQSDGGHMATADHAGAGRDSSSPSDTEAVADGAGASPLEATDAESASMAEAHPENPRDERTRQDQAEWETQWSEAGGSGTPESARHAVPAAEQASVQAAQPVHHAEYTESHAPTLPGAETAAVEEDDAGPSAAARTGADRSYSPGADVPVGTGAATAPGSPDSGTGSTAGDAVAAPAAESAAADFAAAETTDRTQSSALAENGADHLQAPPSAPPQGAPEPQGHLAAEEPYGAGSAGAGADGSGPAEYTVKGDAGSMVYYEEGHPDYDGTRADVWFESAAHAEAAGFRAPRRRRL